MQFEEALLKMIEGKKVYRKDMTGSYFMILPKQDYIWKIFNHSELPQVFSPNFSVKDYLARDWEELM